MGQGQVALGTALGEAPAGSAASGRLHLHGNLCVVEGGTGQHAEGVEGVLTSDSQEEEGC